MKTIIAPTDFSAVSINAVDYAADMAVDISAELILFHVSEQPVTVSEVSFTEPVYDKTVSEEKITNLKNSLNIRTKNKINIRIKNIAGAIHGAVHNELEDLCKQKKPFAVVMGTHGNGTIQRFFIGSATFYAARHLPYPVLVVPKGVRYKPVKKIVLASDLKTINTIRLNEIRTVTDAFSATLDVIHVNKASGEVAKEPIEKYLLESYLKEFHPKFHFINDSSVEKGIELFAQKNDIDLILILPKKHGPFHKSQSKEFVFHSPVPVITIHEK
ncbi:MAG TPA: universal stress protein [Chitinophagaceae bacterium]|nr:universal stress protein [Chitinophagaceae bacterium]